MSQRCEIPSYINLRQPPKDGFVLVTGCRQSLADTDHYVYRYDQGRIVLAGLSIRTAPERLRQVLDSVHAALRSRLGRSTECRENRTFFGPIYAWDLDSVAVTLWADSIFGVYEVGVEARTTERLCDEPKRAPAPA